MQSEPEVLGNKAEPELQRRSGVTALLAGALCAMFAVLAIVGPAIHQTSRVSWPGASHEMLGPAPLGTPFILAERTPARLDVDIPCAALSAPTSSTSERRVLLATARRPVDVSGIVVSSIGNVVTVTRGEVELGTATVPDSTGGCNLGITFDGTSWVMSVDGSPSAGGPEAAPIMSGLYTDVPPSTAGSAAPRVRFETLAQNSTPSGRQWLFMGASGLLGVATVLLLLRRDGRRLVRRVGLLRGLRPRGPDVVVLTGLLIAWVGSSTLSDDGWVLSTVFNRRPSGTFSNYFDAYNTPITLGSPQDFIYHAMRVVNSDLVWFRIPTVIAWTVAWIVCRRMLDRTLESATPRLTRLATWTLASVFLLGVFAAGMTLRPEFLTGPLALAAAWFLGRFRAAPSASGLVPPMVCFAVAFAIHPVGAICLAPFVLSIPVAWRWLGKDDSGALLAVGAATLVGFAVGLLLVFADSDAHLWRTALDLTALTQLHDGGILNELNRYRLLFTPSWGLPLLRLTFILPMVAAWSAVWRWTRGRRSGTPVDISLSWVYLLAVALLATVPSKWPNHLAAVVPFAALATAVEASALGAAANREGRSRVRSALAVGVTLLGIAVVGYLAFFFEEPHETWVAGAFVDVDLTVNAPRVYAVVLAVTVVLFLVMRWRRAKRSPAPLTAGRSLIVALPILTTVAVVPSLIGLTVADTVESTTGWSLLRQNLGLAEGSCGVASVVMVGDPMDATALRPAREATDKAADALEVTPGRAPVGAPGVREVARPGADGARGTIATPWQIFGDDDREAMLEFWVSGSWWTDSRATVHAEFGRSTVDGIDVLDRLDLEPATRLSVTPEERWTPSYAILGGAAADADRVRLVVEKSFGPDMWVGLSGLSSIPEHRLDRLIAAQGSRQVAHPNLVPFLPCLQPAPIVLGRTAVPTFAIEPAGQTTNAFTLFGRGPWFMELDAFGVPFVPLPVRPTAGHSSETAQLLAVTTIDTTQLQPYADAATLEAEANGS